MNIEKQVYYDEMIEASKKGGYTELKKYMLDNYSELLEYFTCIELSEVYNSWDDYYTYGYPYGDCQG